MTSDSHSPTVTDPHSKSDFWEPKRTLTLEAARRHTARVRVFRRTLLVLAGLLIAYLLVQFMRTPPSAFPEDNPEESIKMISPRYSGRTDDGLPFFLTASEAVRTTSNSSEVNLIAPVLNFYRIEGADVSKIIAEAGTYDDAEKVLTLTTTVNLETDDGTFCRSTHARVYARTKEVEGDAPISCTGNFGSASGQSYQILDNFKAFVFKDGMTAILEQDGDTDALIDPTQTPDTDTEIQEDDRP